MAKDNLDIQTYGPFLGNRWVQLITAIIGMVMIANLQYAWTLFSTPLREQFKVSLAAIQYAFTLFIMFETFVQPVGGYILDRFGCRLAFTIAGVMVGVGWAMIGQANSVGALYFYYSLAGVGAAIIYGGSIAVAVRWFPERRGMASGLIATGFGMGALPFLPLIGSLLKSSGPAAALLYTGVFQGLIILVAAQILRYPVKRTAAGATAQASKAVDEATRGFNFKEMLVTPHFWLIWLMFLSVNIGGLLMTAQSRPFATSMGLAAFVITAVAVQTGANGIARVGWGWVSDKIGRYQTMTISFGLNAIFLFLMPIFGNTPVGYVTLAGLIILTWGQCFALFPAVNADVFGTTYAATNYGFLYSAKGFAAFFGGGLGAYLAGSFGWGTVFSATACFSLFAALMSLYLPRMQKPTRPGLAVGTSKIQA